MLDPMGQRVLVVEDEDDIAFPLVRTLEREGYDVEWVDSGQKALDSLAVTPAKVMILDLGLPDFDGLEVCRRARESGYDGAIMIVTAGPASSTAWSGSTTAPTTTSPSRSGSPSCRRGCARCCVVPPR